MFQEGYSACIPTLSFLLLKRIEPPSLRRYLWIRLAVHPVLVPPARRGTYSAGTERRGRRERPPAVPFRSCLGRQCIHTHTRGPARGAIEPPGRSEAQRLYSAAEAASPHPEPLTSSFCSSHTQRGTTTSSPTMYSSTTSGRIHRLQLPQVHGMVAPFRSGPAAPQRLGAGPGIPRGARITRAVCQASSAAPPRGRRLHAAPAKRRSADSAHRHPAPAALPPRVASGSPTSSYWLLVLPVAGPFPPNRTWAGARCFSSRRGTRSDRYFNAVTAVRVPAALRGRVAAAGV